MDDPSSRMLAALERGQLLELARVLGALGDNPFYGRRLASAGLGGGVESLADFCAHMPFTTKAELVLDQHKHPPYGSNLTRPLGDYVRAHQTSSTTGVPLRWLDTQANWDFLKRGWREVLAAAGVVAQDRVLVAFSFGPFLGPWLAMESAQDLGALVFSGGGLSSEARLRLVMENEITVLCCTPTYALRLIEVAENTGVDLAAGKVRTIVVGAEPGGSVPAVRERIEAAWRGAHLHDHYGQTEAGSITYQCPSRPEVVHIAESLYLAEVIDPETGTSLPFDQGLSGELVVTTLGRVDSPVLRYRTGDIVRPMPRATCTCGRIELALARGVLGRADDMVHIRGVNLFPSSVDAILRRFDGVAEYRIHVRTKRGMRELKVEVEATKAAWDKPTSSALCDAIARAFRTTHGLSVEVHITEPGSLPRFEHKSQRWSTD